MVLSQITHLGKKRQLLIHNGVQQSNWTFKMKVMKIHLKD